MMLGLIASTHKIHSLYPYFILFEGGFFWCNCMGDDKHCKKIPPRKAKIVTASIMGSFFIHNRFDSPIEKPPKGYKNPLEASLMSPSWSLYPCFTPERWVMLLGG
jgi:hypothetical protein